MNDIRKSRLKWLGHDFVISRSEEFIVKKALNMKFRGKISQGRQRKYGKT